MLIGCAAFVVGIALAVVGYRHWVARRLRVAVGTLVLVVVVVGLVGAGAIPLGWGWTGATYLVTLALAPRLAPLLERWWASRGD